MIVWCFNHNLCLLSTGHMIVLTPKAFNSFNPAKYRVGYSCTYDITLR